MLSTFQYAPRDNGKQGVHPLVILFKLQGSVRVLLFGCVNPWMDQGATWCGDRPRPRTHCVRRGSSSPSPPKSREKHPPSFRSMFVAVNRLHGSTCHLLWRQASALATLCKIGTQSLPKGHILPNFRPIYVVIKWLNGSRCHLVGI